MIGLKSISKKYTRGSEVCNALNDITFNIDKGDFCAVIGASGAGKSTLLYVIGGLIRPDSGSVLFNGSDIYNFTGREISRYRRKNLGFMFQQFHLMPWLSVLGNIKLACNGKEMNESIDFYLEKCSLTEMKNKYPSELSVGEKQRTAFIRAIISGPDILLADEPTGNLDAGNKDILMSLVGEYNKSGGTVIVVSHDPAIAGSANKRITLDRGTLIMTTTG